MNWLFLVVVVFLLLAARSGYRKGFIRKAVGMVSWILTLTVTSVSVPYISAFLKDKTELNDMVLGGAAFLVTLLLVGALVKGIGISLNFVAKLPVLGGLNKAAGMVLGLAESVLVVWIGFIGITIGGSTDMGMKLLLMIADSQILTWMYQNNLLLGLLGM